MRQQFIEKWVKPVVNSPRATVAGIGAMAALFLPHHAEKIATAVAAVGLLFAGDANKNG
jgi:hypothetical protein